MPTFSLWRKRWQSNRPASHFFFLAIRSGNARRSNPTFNILKWTSFWRSILIIGGKGGIRTHVRLPANAFRERPVTTTSVLFHSYFFFLSRSSLKNSCMISRHSFSMTPDVTAMSVFETVDFVSSRFEITAPLFGSSAPITILSILDSMIAPAHIEHGSRVVYSVSPGRR